MNKFYETNYRKAILDEDGNQVVTKGVKTIWIEKTKQTANELLSKTDWMITRKTEKGTAIPDAIVTFRDGVRTAYETRKTEINNCSDIASLKTLYDATYDSDGKFEKYNMTQYPSDPNKWA